MMPLQWDARTDRMSLDEAISRAEAALDDAQSELDLAQREVRGAEDRLESLRKSLVSRRSLRPGQYFEIGGEVFRRIGSQEEDFGGRVGLCFRAHRQRLAGRLESAGDAEWLQLEGTARLFANREEAEEYLALDDEEDSIDPKKGGEER